jgi:hypothetical protein
LRNRADGVGLRLGYTIPRRMPSLLLLIGLALGPVAFAQGDGRASPTHPSAASARAATSDRSGICMNKDAFLRTLETEFRAGSPREVGAAALARLKEMSWVELRNFFDCLGPVSYKGPDAISEYFRVRGGRELMEVAVDITTVPIPLRAGRPETIEASVIARLLAVLQNDNSVTISGLYIIEAL